MFNQGWFKMIGLYLLPLLASWIQGNAAVIEAFIAKEGGYGAEAVIAAVTKISPYFGALLQAAYTELGPDLPKYEGDAVAWLLAVIAAAIKKLQG